MSDLGIALACDGGELNAMSMLELPDSDFLTPDVLNGMIGCKLARSTCDEKLIRRTRRIMEKMSPLKRGRFDENEAALRLVAAGVNLKKTAAMWAPPLPTFEDDIEMLEDATILPEDPMLVVATKEEESCVVAAAAEQVEKAEDAGYVSKGCSPITAAAAAASMDVLDEDGWEETDVVASGVHVVAMDEFENVFDGAAKSLEEMENAPRVLADTTRHFQVLSKIAPFGIDPRIAAFLQKKMQSNITLIRGMQQIPY